MKNYLKITLFCTILLFFGCKKSINYSNSDQIASFDNFAVTKFLSVPENLSPDIKEIVRDISKQQIKEPFLVDFINKYGIPKWDKTITSHPALSTIDNSQTKSNTVDNQADFVSPIYLIPLVDTLSSEVKSYILCTKVKDSIFRYNVFNKQSILEKPATSPKDIFNGSMMLAGISALENNINKKSISEYPSPFGTQNDVKFKISKVELNSASNNKIQTNSIIVKKSQGDDCIKQTYTPVMAFDFFFVIDYTQYGFHMSFLIGSCNGALIVDITPWGNANYGTAPPPTNGPSFNFTDNSQINGSYLFNSNATSGGTSFSNLNQAGSTPNLPPWTDPDASLYSQATTQGRSRPVLSLISKIPNLSNDQLDWISNPSNISFLNDLNTALSEFEEITDAEIQAAKFTIDLYKAGIQDNFDNDAGANILSISLPLPNSPYILFQKYMSWANMNYTVLKKENPTWNPVKLWIHSQIEAFHVGLEFLAFTPLAPEAILIDAALYAYQGNGSSATINVVLAGVPGALLAGNVRILAKTIISPITTKSFKLFHVYVGDLVIFPSRSALRRIIGLTSKLHEAHHVIPWEMRFHSVLQAAAKSSFKFHLNEFDNGIPLLKEINQNAIAHEIYNDKIAKKLDDILGEISPFILDKAKYNDEAAKRLNALRIKVKKWLTDHPNLNLNELVIE